MYSVNYLYLYLYLSYTLLCDARKTEKSPRSDTTTIDNTDFWYVSESIHTARYMLLCWKDVSYINNKIFTHRQNRQTQTQHKKKQPSSLIKSRLWIITLPDCVKLVLNRFTKILNKPKRNCVYTSKMKYIYIYIYIL